MDVKMKALYALLRAVDPVDGASSDGLFAALAGARVGQAAATIGDAYSILQEHVATDRSDVAAFFKLLTILIIKFETMPVSFCDFLFSIGNRS